jgi:electron transport complex protein RnfG
MKEMLKLGAALAVYSVVACVLLAVVDGKTAPIIAGVKAAGVEAGLKEIYTDADSFDAPDDFTATTIAGVTVDSLYLAKKGGTTIGAVVQATGPTYDKSTLLIGVTTDRRIVDTKFMAISDTPGFGQKAPAFYAGKFAGKSIDDAFELKADVDAISGSTITSRGVTKIVKTAVTIAGDYLAR